MDVEQNEQQYEKKTVQVCLDMCNYDWWSYQL